jgi:hypothetical protein
MAAEAVRECDVFPLKLRAHAEGSMTYAYSTVRDLGTLYVVGWRNPSKGKQEVLKVG